MTENDAIRRLRLLCRAHEADLAEAKRGLAQALGDEEGAGAARDAADAAIHAETVAAEISAGDAEVEAFARWLPRAQARVREAEQMLAQAAAVTAQRRAELVLVRAAAEAAEEALNAALAALGKQREAAEQVASDDLAAQRVAWRGEED